MEESEEDVSTVDSMSYRSVASLSDCKGAMRRTMSVNNVG